MSNLKAKSYLFWTTFTKFWIWIFFIENLSRERRPRCFSETPHCPKSIQNLKSFNNDKILFEKIKNLKYETDAPSLSFILNEEKKTVKEKC